MTLSRPHGERPLKTLDVFDGTGKQPKQLALFPDDRPILGYCLTVTLKNMLCPHAPGLTPRAVLEKLGRIQMVDMQIPTTDGRWLTMPRHTQPEAEQQMILARLGLEFPPQPPPRITAGQVSPPATHPAELQPAPADV
jgi:hypothetical protein